MPKLMYDSASVGNDIFKSKRVSPTFSPITTQPVYAQFMPNGNLFAHARDVGAGAGLGGAGGGPLNVRFSRSF